MAVPLGIPTLSSLRAAGSRLAILMIAAVIAAVLALFGVLVLIAALYLWLETKVDAPLAALLTGVIVLVIAVTVMLVGRLASRPPSRRYSAAGARSQSAAFADASIAAAMGDEAGQAAGAWLRSHGPHLVLAAAAAGFIVGVSPRARAAIWRQLQ
ncbi:MAG: phage holin family protein [Rhodospirillales bacterium]|nr:phage holin family protein [Rhodospirillales bacterium]